jgi:hypothetical protein
VSVLEWDIAGSSVFAVGLIGAGGALLFWWPHWVSSWMITATGVGLAAQRWVSWKYVLVVGVLLLALYGAGRPRPKSVEESALLGSWTGLALSIGFRIGQQRNRALNRSNPRSDGPEGVD